MKRILLILAVHSMLIVAFGQTNNDKTIIYLARHAEKEAGKDPVLTGLGMQRAGSLYDKLKDAGISKIYVSQYLRTQMTADSLRIKSGIDTVHYMADTDGMNLLYTIMAHSDFGKRILVIGHSNTIPGLIRLFGVDDFSPENIPDHEYDNLYRITYKNEKADLIKMKYGPPSGKSAVMQ